MVFDLGIKILSPIIGAQLKESQLTFVVGDQHVFGLAIVVEHHFMGFPTDAGFFVSAKRSVGWIGVVTVDPNPACLNGA